MRDADSLIRQAAEDPRLPKQAKWVQGLIYGLASRLELEIRSAEGVRQRAEREVSEARSLLTEGPADSDTFMDLARSLADTYDDVPQRPLGKGVNIEFRTDGMQTGEGVNVKLMEDGTLHVHGLGHLAVIPVNHSYLKIETR
jgi:hypothetical protein